MEIDANAPVITRDETLIDAPAEVIWNIQTDIAAWPRWQPEVDAAQLDGPLAVGSVFYWETAGLRITSTVQELDPPRRIVWSGPAPGITAVHVWELTPTDQWLVRPGRPRIWVDSEILTIPVSGGAARHPR